MAVCVLLEIPNGTQEMYDTTTSRLNYESNWPEGLISHLAGPGENGGWFVVSEWESREAFERFLNERLRPIAEQPGGPGPIRPRIFTVYRERYASAQQGQRARAA